MELVLLRFEVQLVLQEAFQDYPDMGDVIHQGGLVDQDVDDIYTTTCPETPCSRMPGTLMEHWLINKASPSIHSAQTLC